MAKKMTTSGAKWQFVDWESNRFSAQFAKIIDDREGGGGSDCSLLGIGVAPLKGVGWFYWQVLGVPDMLSVNESKWVVAALTALGLTACGSSSGDSDDFDPLPQSNNPNVPQYVVPISNNGFYLTSETVRMGDGNTFRQIEYVLNEAERTFSELDLDAGGESHVAVIYNYNEIGAITERRNVDSQGNVVQRFESHYDERRRVTTESSFNGEDGFIVIDYRFNDVGAPFSKVVRAAQNDAELSTTSFQYDNDRLLAASTLSSPLLPGEVRRLYSFMSVEELDEMGDPIEVDYLQSIIDELGARVEFEYDQFNNVSMKTTFAESGEIIFTAEYEYASTDSVVPNLPLHQIAYEYDQIF